MKGVIGSGGLFIVKKECANMNGKVVESENAVFLQSRRNVDIIIAICPLSCIRSLPYRFDAEHEEESSH